MKTTIFKGRSNRKIPMTSKTLTVPPFTKAEIVAMLPLVIAICFMVQDHFTPVTTTEVNMLDTFVLPLALGSAGMGLASKGHAIWVNATNQSPADSSAPQGSSNQAPPSPPQQPVASSTDQLTEED